MNMIVVIVAVVLGVIVSILGISILNGNIAAIPRFHRKRVAEEDKDAFCKSMGAGMLIIGLSFLVFGGCAFAAVKTLKTLFTIVGAAVVVVAVIVGLGISYRAMFKYNKGIF